MRNIKVKFRSPKGSDYKVLSVPSADEAIVREAFAKVVPEGFIISMEDLGETPAPPKPPKFEPKPVEKP